jgi:hypothetical protein
MKNMIIGFGIGVAVSLLFVWQYFYDVRHSKQTATIPLSDGTCLVIPNDVLDMCERRKYSISTFNSYLKIPLDDLKPQPIYPPEPAPIPGPTPIPDPAPHAIQLRNTGL